MPVDLPDMHDPQAEESSLPQSPDDSDDESLAGPQLASIERKPSWNMEDVDSNSGSSGARSLIEAVLGSGCHEIRKILKKQGVDVDEKGPDGRTALSFAIEKRKYKSVEWLLQYYGADPNTREDQNRTPFFWAATPGQFDSNYRYDEMIKSLLRAGADPNLTDDQGDNPLARAAAIGNGVFVERILSIASATEISIEIDINLENKNTDGYTALSLAAKSGHCYIVAILVESGLAEINTDGNDETSPLICAAAGGWPICMEYLLSHGAYMGTCTWWERFLQTRSQPGKEPDPFQWRKSDLKVLTSWLENCSFWNEVLPDGRTFLSWAVEFKDEVIVKLLLDLKADPDIRDTTKHQMTPLIKALKLGNMAVVSMLKEKDKYSMHILVGQADRMSEEQALGLARNLLREGYDLNRTDFEGRNPVHIASQKGRKRWVQEFLHPDYSTFIHYEDNSGKTPLQYAMDEDIVKLLVKHGGEIRDVPTASLFKLREPKPHCVQLNRTPPAPYRNGKMRLLLISDYDEAREMWNPQPGEIQLRLFNRGSQIPEFGTPELEEDLALSGKYCRFFQPKCPTQSGETKMFKLCISLPDLKRPSERFPLEIAWAIREIGSKLAYGYISTLPISIVPDNHEGLLKGLITEVAEEWRQRASDLMDGINKIRLNQVNLQGRTRTVLESLQSKAQQQATLQSWLQDHIAGLTHVVDIDPYLLNEKPGDQKGRLRERIRDMDQEVSSGLARIEQNVRELLQIEIAWISIREAKSTKRLTWITFIFLPLMFASSIFGMNINLLKENPDWRWFLPIAASLILLSFALWLLFDWAEQQWESWMERLITPRENPKYTAPDDGRKSFESSVV